MLLIFFLFNVVQGGEKNCASEVAFINLQRQELALAIQNRFDLVGLQLGSKQKIRHKTWQLFLNNRPAEKLKLYKELLEVSLINKKQPFGTSSPLYPSYLENIYWLIDRLRETDYQDLSKEIASLFLNLDFAKLVALHLKTQALLSFPNDAPLIFDWVFQPTLPKPQLKESKDIGTYAMRNNWELFQRIPLFVFHPLDEKDFIFSRAIPFVYLMEVASHPKNAHGSLMPPFEYSLHDATHSYYAGLADMGNVFDIEISEYVLVDLSPAQLFERSGKQLQLVELQKDIYETFVFLMNAWGKEKNKTVREESLALFHLIFHESRIGLPLEVIGKIFESVRTIDDLRKTLRTKAFGLENYNENYGNFSDATANFFLKQIFELKKQNW